MLKLAGLGVALLLALGSHRAEAGYHSYPWCFEDRDAYDCTFSSWSQCMETARGLAGICRINMTYQAPVRIVRHRRRPRSH